MILQIFLIGTFSPEYTEIINNLRKKHIQRWNTQGRYLSIMAINTDQINQKFMHKHAVKGAASTSV